ncbi:MAG: sensor histidine kinase [Planctomycetia bacterium]
MSHDSGAWLLVQSANSPAIAYAVPRPACLGLTRAVLAGGDDLVAWRALAGGDPAIAAWLAASRRDETPVAASRESLLARLSSTLVLGAPPVGVACASEPFSPLPMEPALEAQLLAAAVERMLAHERLSARFDEALAEARLEALRELAYGAGHEINNPLANIATRAQALLLDERDAERRRRLATIVDQSFRARDMIGGLMLFARPPKPQPGETDIGGLVAAVIESIQQAAVGRGVRLHYSPSPTPLSAHIDRGQIEEAVRAIAVNAIEAVEDGGRVTLSVGSVAGPSAAEAGWCEIVVADDGKGMDAASLRRAFDPFYSGREAGRGAGLGLSKAWRFAEASGGRVVIESKPGEGTRVAVVLPTRALTTAR